MIAGQIQIRLNAYLHDSLTLKQAGKNNCGVIVTPAWDTSVENININLI